MRRTPGLCLGPAALHSLYRGHRQGHSAASPQPSLLRGRQQVYVACTLSECTALKSRMIHSIESIGAWMASNRLALNPLKSEFMWCASLRRTHLIDKSAFVLPDGSVNVSSSVRNLGVYFDESLSMTDHVNRLVRTCFYKLRRIRYIRRSLTAAVATRLVNSFVIARIDFCNSILAGLPR